MKYPIAEKFKAVQGEGIYTGTPMAFIRFIGCSVGKKICTLCDTDFETAYPTFGGGLFTADELCAWVGDYQHVCFTGGEPLDRDLTQLTDFMLSKKTGVNQIHVESSGTKLIPSWLSAGQARTNVWLTISPKPGYLEEAIREADELKVIVPGLGSGPGWPKLEDAKRWATWSIPVFLQPANFKAKVDEIQMRTVLKMVEQNPELRLSAQLHKYLQCR